MNRKKENPVICAEVKTCKILRNYLDANKLTELCDISEVSRQNAITINYNDYQNTYNTPIKLGEILDQLNHYNNERASNHALIYFGEAMLDKHQGIFTKEDGKQIYLTEKEVKIISFLHENKNKTIAREELLSAVWGYSKDIETHTLETHIYRLRQKIEQYPTNPKILVTNDDGYIMRGK